MSYNLSVRSNDGGVASATGTTNPSTGLLGLGFANLNTGTNQDFHFDNPTLAPIPEPTALSAAGLLLATGARSRRNGKASRGTP